MRRIADALGKSTRFASFRHYSKTFRDIDARKGTPSSSRTKRSAMLSVDIVGALRGVFRRFTGFLIEALVGLGSAMSGGGGFPPVGIM